MLKPCVRALQRLLSVWQCTTWPALCTDMQIPLILQTHLQQAGRSLLYTLHRVLAPVIQLYNCC